MHHQDRGFHGCLLSLLLLAFFMAPVSAQTGSLNRPYEPVVLNGSSFSGYSGNIAPINQLFLYKYNSAGNSWEQIPLQIDEVELVPGDTTGKTSYFETGDGLLDDLDELSFMAKDAGDQAPASNWITDASSRSFERYEIEVSDLLASGSRGYVYLYRSATLVDSPALADYVTYIAPPPGQANDIVRGQTYEEGHDMGNGINNSLLVPVNADGSGNNFLDRLKLRVQIVIPPFINIVIDEADFIYVGVRVKDGRVRVIRELTERIQLITAIDVPLLITYYSSSIVLNTALNLRDVPGVALLRQSFDFAPNVAGANWYNQNITNPVTVDGNPDSPDIAIVNAPQLNWYMLSSAQGSFVGIFSLPSDLGSQQRFYYRDAPSGTNEGGNVADTGDNMSFGDSGLWISGSNISGVFPLALTNFVLGKNQSRSVGETLRNQTAQPLQANIRAQTPTSPVELVTFMVTADRDNAILQWRTASESNNFCFYIERRSVSTNWQEVGFVAGNATVDQSQTYSFTDTRLSPGKYYYRLRQVDIGGQLEYSPAIEVTVLVPSQLALAPAYPNPFAPGAAVAVLRYQLPNPGSVAVSLRIINVLGQQVRQLVNTTQTGGYYEARWDGRLENGERAPAGVYFYQLQAGALSATKKLLLY